MAGFAVALNERVCGEPGASSEIVKLAVRGPVPRGLKTSEIVQLAAGASRAVQVLVTLNSEELDPPRATEEMCSGAMPELVNFSVCAAPEVPCVVAGNDSVAGEKVTAGTVAIPVPLSAMVCGDPGTLSEMTRLAVRWPGVVGLKTSEIVQLADGATGDVQLLVTLNSVGLGPVRETEETCKGALPELMAVRVCGALDDPWLVAGKDGVAGEKVTAGTAAEPVPLRARVCGEPGALSATRRLAVNAPALEGAKVILTEQLFWGASVAGHVFV